MRPGGLLVLGPLWVHILTQTCGGEDLPREAVLSWFTERVLEGLGLEEAPRTAVQGPHRDTVGPEAKDAAWRTGRTNEAARTNHQSGPKQETSEIILFPGSEPTCVTSSLGGTTTLLLTYSFQPSMNTQQNQITSAHFWFYAGEGASANSSAQLLLLTSAQQLFPVAESPTTVSSDGWTTYHMDQNLWASLAGGPFTLQIQCPVGRCHVNQPDMTPFLHLNAQRRVPVRSARQVPATVPWSPSVVDLLQRPSQDRTAHSDCHRAEVDISFEELGWDNWIVQPKVLTFYYCHGNCSAGDRFTTRLGISQCCAPVPGTMKSLRITTTSDGGYSFKYETLPNIVPEECSCV